MSREGEGRVGKGRYPEAAAFAVKIALFWPSDPMLWFTQV